MNQSQIQNKFKNMIQDMTTEALKNLVQDYRAQVKIGLMSDKDCHDRINHISVVLMRRELGEDDDYEENLWKEPTEGGQSVGDDLMTNGWED